MMPTYERYKYYKKQYKNNIDYYKERRSILRGSLYTFDLFEDYEYNVIIEENNIKLKMEGIKC